MFLRRFFWDCALLTIVCSSGCTFQRKRKAPPAHDTRPLRLGQVALVNEAEHFALIETFSSAPPAVGTILRIYRGDAVTAELRATSVRRKPFLVADLVSGAPAKGDEVFQPRGENPQSPRAEPALTSDAPAAATPPPRKGRWRRWLFPFGFRFPVRE
jgi:hypothetical protein